MAAMASDTTSAPAAAAAAGGSDSVLLTAELLDVAAASGAVGSAEAGGISVFVGTTRRTFQGRVVVRLEYEAYEAMARREMEGLCGKVRAGWPDVVKVAVHHRLGFVPVGEASVVIAVSSPHRREAIGKNG